MSEQPKNQGKLETHTVSKFTVAGTIILLIIAYGLSLYVFQHKIDVIKTIINSVGIFITALITALMVMYKLDKQHESSLELQRESYKKNLDLKTYHEIVNAANKASSALSSFSSEIFTLINLIEESSKGALHRRPYSLIGFAKKESSTMMSVINPMYILERYEIGLPKFIIFRLALSAELEKIRSISASLMNNLLIIAKPDPANSNLVYLEPQPSDVSNFIQHGDNYTDATDELSSYLSDLIIAAQNKLLSGIYNNTIDTRKPADPSITPITIDPYNEDAIIKYLEGRSIKGGTFEKVLSEYKARN